MANFIFNVALGQVVGYYRRVDENDPANSVLSVIALDANGDTDATMRTRETLSALLAGTANEVTNSGYGRKTLTDADIVAFAADHVNNRVDLDIPDQTFTSIGAGTPWTDIVIAYDNDSTSGTDASIIPLTLHDFAVTPNGGDITVVIATAGFFRAVSS